MGRDPLLGRRAVLIGLRLRGPSVMSRENVGFLFCRTHNLIPRGMNLGRDFMIKEHNVGPEAPPVENHCSK